jgi:hypothetical protein
LQTWSCGLQKKLRLRNCRVAVGEQHFFKRCEIAIAEVLPSSCGIAIAEVASAHHCPLHSLTGSVVQPFASHLGGQLFVLRGCTNSRWNWVSPDIIDSLHWWPGTPTWLITGLALGSAPTMGSFTRVRADDVKSQLWSHIAFPSSILLLAGPPSSCNTVTG